MFKYIVLLIVLFVSILFYLKNTRSVILELNGKQYKISAKRNALIQKAQQGDIKAQYEIITEYYQAFPRPKQFIPELCFAFTQELAQKEQDLGVLTELGDMYFEGVGTPRDPKQAAAMYKRAIELYDNPTPGLYIPEKSAQYRQFLQDTLSKYQTGK